jgi:glutamyl-tRNA synthetase
MREDAPALLGAARDALAAADRFDATAVEEALSPLPERLGVGSGKLYQPIRVAITGTTVSPGIFESVAALGRERTHERIDAALARLGARPD